VEVPRIENSIVPMGVLVVPHLTASTRDFICRLYRDRGSYSLRCSKDRICLQETL